MPPSARFSPPPSPWPLSCGNSTPGLAHDLRHTDTFELPDDLDLKVAWALGRRARITGSVWGFPALMPHRGNHPAGVNAVAQCHYAPVAWQLVISETPQLRTLGGRWPSIRHWTSVPETATVLLSQVLDPLPRVTLPRDGQDFGWQWTELLADEHCYIVECDDISPHRSS